METKKKGFLSLFVTETEDSEVKAQATASQTETANVSTPTPHAVAGTIDEDIKKQLLGVLSENNIQGYDYFEFRESLQNMKSVIPSEPDRFKAAYAAVASLVTVDRLVQTADVYVGALQKRKQEFDQYTQGLMEQKVESKETQAKSIEQDMAKMQEQITKLNQNIVQLQEKKTALLNESVAEKSKIEIVKMNFDITYQAVVSNIEQDKQKIKTYLSGKGDA